jgi:hypothetical protein
MRYGISMLLREFVEAEEIEIGDCERFQITCPACREPVFKKERSRADGGITHFLSHYRAETPDEKDCELRVDAIGREHLERFSFIGRGQTLDGFMAVLRDAIIRGQAFMQPPGEYQKSLNRLLSRPVFDGFMRYANDAASAILKFPDPRQAVVDCMAGFPRFEDRSPFWHRRQASYVLDVLRHLATPQARQNMRVLAAAAYLNIGLTADNYRRHRDTLAIADIRYDPQAAVNLIEALVKGKSTQAMHKLSLRWSGADRARNQDEAARCLDAVHRAIVAELVGPMIGILAAVPFPDLARDRNATMQDQEGVAVLQRLMAALLGDARWLAGERE